MHTNAVQRYLLSLTAFVSTAHMPPPMPCCRCNTACELSDSAYQLSDKCPLLAARDFLGPQLARGLCAHVCHVLHKLIEHNLGVRHAVRCLVHSADDGAHDSRAACKVEDMVAVMCMHGM